MITLLLSTLLLLTAQGGDRCAQVSISASQSVIAAGTTQSFHVVTTNCGDKAVRMELEVEIAPACGDEFELADNYARLQPGGSFIAGNTTWAIPADSCAGVYVATAIVKVGNTVLATESTEFEVIEP